MTRNLGWRADWWRIRNGSGTHLERAKTPQSPAWKAHIRADKRGKRFNIKRLIRDQRNQPKLVFRKIYIEYSIGCCLLPPRSLHMLKFIFLYNAFDTFLLETLSQLLTLLRFALPYKVNYIRRFPHLQCLLSVPTVYIRLRRYVYSHVGCFIRCGTPNVQ